MSLMLDSSATLAWMYADETADAIRHVFNLLGGYGARVPGLWKLEAANILEMGVRRGHRDGSGRFSPLADLAPLPIRIDPEKEHQAWGATARLASRRNLTVFDEASWNGLRDAVFLW